MCFYFGNATERNICVWLGRISISLADKPGEAVLDQLPAWTLINNHSAVLRVNISLALSGLFQLQDFGCFVVEGFKISVYCHRKTR